MYLLDGRKVQGERDFTLAWIPLEFIPNNKVTLVMEHKQVWKGIQEDVKVLELLRPRLSKVNQRKWSRIFYENIHCNY